MQSLREYRNKADRLADFLPWAALVAPGVVLNKDGSFQRSARFRGPDLDSATPAELIASLGAEHIVEFSVQGALELDSVASLPSVRQARREAAGFALIVGEPHVTIPALLATLERQALPLRSLTTHHATLEDVFVSLTGRTLRDE